MGTPRLRKAAKLKRFLASAVLALGLFGISVAWAPSAESQIGYTTVSVASDLSVGTADFTLQGDDLFVGFGESDDWQVEYNSAGDYLRFKDDSSVHQFYLDNVPAGQGGNFILQSVTLPAMDGSDTVSLIELNPTNANHTGSGNTLRGLDIGSITGDAQASEHALHIDSGWDAEINLASTAPVVRFANNGTLHFKESGGDASVFVIQDAGAVTDGIVHTRAATTNNGSHFSAGRASSFAAQNGSDLAAFFRVDGFTDAAHTSTGNDILALHAETITTPDADSTHSIIGAEGGWDFFVWNNAALGTDAWTTASDKSANTAAGTLKVEIDGTLYHIQLYTDS